MNHRTSVLLTLLLVACSEAPPPLMSTGLGFKPDAAPDAAVFPDAASVTDSSCDCGPAEPFVCGAEAGMWPDAACPDGGRD